MKTILSLLLPLLFLFPYPLLAQQKTGNDRIHFSSQNYIGMIEGEIGVSFQVQSINGISYKSWFTGIGTGIDHYYERSIPLFLSIGKFLPTGKIPFYLNGDFGINVPWVRFPVYYEGNNKLHSSFYWAGGLGYKSGSKKNKHGFLLNVGYSFKQLSQKTEYVYPCLTPPCPVDKQSTNYRLNRISVKAGWMF